LNIGETKSSDVDEIALDMLEYDDVEPPRSSEEEWKIVKKKNKKRETNSKRIDLILQ
jgi:hypothetical protein